MTEQQEQAEWVPAFPGQRPPFAPGNTLGQRFAPGHEVTLRHGAYSPRCIDDRAQEVAEQLLADDGVAFLREPAYRAALWRYAQRQARADLLHAFLLEHGEDCQGCRKCEGLEKRWREFDTAADKASQRLGLDPLSRARLGRDVAAATVDAASFLTAMRSGSATPNEDEEVSR